MSGVECPAWCSNHWSATTPQGVLGDTHSADLWVLGASLGGNPRHWFELSAGQYTVPGEGVIQSAPTISLTSAEGIAGVPCIVSPDQARELAAAMLRAADIVEASWTTRCPSCDAAVAQTVLSPDPESGRVACDRCRAASPSLLALLDRLKDGTD